MQKLQDFRDNRGKRHDLSLVMVNFLLAILRCSSPSSLSAIHRQMVYQHLRIVELLVLPSQPCISYSQLRRTLCYLELEQYNRLNERYFGVSVASSAGEWCGIDGKELRGTIDGVSGQKRGVNIVRALCHESMESSIIGFYDGDKESEKTIVSDYLCQNLKKGACYSLDALHTSNSLMEAIHNGGGVYLVQSKGNQKLLTNSLQEYHLHWPALWKHQECEKGHGRIETRKGWVYDLSGTMETKWEQAGLCTLLVIERTRIRNKDGKEGKETALFVTNKPASDNMAMEFFQAARNHWAIEADHYVRDVTFKEDSMKCFSPRRAKAIASVLNTAINIIRKNNTEESIQQFREKIRENWDMALECLRKSA